MTSSSLSTLHENNQEHYNHDSQSQKQKEPKQKEQIKINDDENLQQKQQFSDSLEQLSDIVQEYAQLQDKNDIYQYSPSPYSLSSISGLLTEWNYSPSYIIFLTLNSFKIGFILLNIILFILLLKRVNKEKQKKQNNVPNEKEEKEKKKSNEKDDFNSSLKKRVLLVTAHPDDEAMFFTPTINSFIDTYDIYFLCLSCGDYDNLGSVRKKELYKSCQILLGKKDIEDYVRIVEGPFKDGPNYSWSPSAVSRTVEEYVEKNSIDAIITFDDYGISGHPNHIDVYRGIQHLVQQWADTNPSINNIHNRESMASTTASSSNKSPSHDSCPYVKVYVLESCNIFRKYSAFLELFVQLLRYNLVLNTDEKTIGDNSNLETTENNNNNDNNNNNNNDNNDDDDEYVFLNPNVRKTFQSMLAHYSQFVWFRKLFIVFSRYTFVNTLNRIY